MLKKNTVLTTARLVMHAYDDCDMDAMTDILLNEEIKKTFMIPDFESRAQAEDLFRRLKGFSRSDDHFEYGVYLDDNLIGFVNDCEIDGDTIEVGYVISPEHKGNGYATEALKAAIAELFRIGYNHVTAGFFEENIASRRVMEKCGMHLLDKTDEEEYLGVTHRCLYCGIDKE